MLPKRGQAITLKKYDVVGSAGDIPTHRAQTHTRSRSYWGTPYFPTLVLGFCLLSSQASGDLPALPPLQPHAHTTHMPWRAKSHESPPWRFKWPPCSAAAITSKRCESSQGGGCPCVLGQGPRSKPNHPHLWESSVWWGPFRSLGLPRGKNELAQAITIA